MKEVECVHPDGWQGGSIVVCKSHQPEGGQVKGPLESHVDVVCHVGLKNIHSRMVHCFSIYTFSPSFRHFSVLSRVASVAH